ncbi:hypothetical protein Tco_0003618 [Tanacetum coccineum]
MYNVLAKSSETLTTMRENDTDTMRERELIPQVPILQLQAFTTVVPLFSTFKASTETLIVISSRIPTIPCLMADSLAVPALYSARAIVVKRALVA